MRTLLRWATIPTLLCGLLATSALAAIIAEVRDEAGLFSADTVRRANEVIDDIHRDFKKDLLIETFKTVPAEKAEEFKNLDKAGRAKFYNDWAIQRARTAKVNGVYILIVKEPGHLQVEVGNETRQKAFTMENRERLVEQMTRKFREAKDAKGDEKQKIYDQALLEGVRFVYSTMKSNIGVSKTSIGTGGPVNAVPINPHPADVQVQHHQANAASGLGGILCWGLLIVGIAWLVIGLIRAFTGGGYGGGGYGGGGWGGGGGGFITGLLGGMFGAMAGSWIYNNFFGSGSSWGGGGGWGSQAQGGEQSSQPQDTDYSGSGGDTGGDDGGGGGGDTGGGGDFGGDDGGGGGDFGGGGGDFGGGGGDFGGGGGDFGGGGGGGDF